MSKEHKNAILITSSQDIDLLNKEKYQGCEVIAGDYSLFYIYKNSIKQYLLDFRDPDFDIHIMIGRIASEWYRNDKGIDNFAFENVSIGNILKYRLSIELSSSLRYYLALKKYAYKYNKLFVSSNAPNSLKLAAECFSQKVEFYKTKNIFDSHTTSSPNRGPINPPPVKPVLSVLLRIFQYPFRSFYQNKVLMISDWTLSDVNHPEILKLNIFNPLKSFCLRYGRKNLMLAKEIYPRRLESVCIMRQLSKVLIDFKINKSDTNNLLSLFTRVIDFEYTKNRKELVNIYCSYKEMFDFYRPSMVIAPGNEHPYYQTIYSISKSRKIPSVFIQDAYGLWLDEYLTTKDINNEVQMIDYFFLMGDHVKNLYKNILGESINVINILPPMLKKYKIVENNSKEKVTIVMFPYGLINSPYCRWDQKYNYVSDVVTALKELGNKRIEIKMKQGFDTYQKKEIFFMKLFLDLCGHNDVKLIFGEFSKHVPRAHFVVGYIGSAILESVYSGVPYYAYEPKILGMTDAFIDKNVTIERSQISRSIFDLKDHISKKKCITLDMTKVLNGNDVSEINFKKLINEFKSHS